MTGGQTGNHGLRANPRAKTKGRTTNSVAGQPMTRTMKNKGKIMNPTLRKYLSLIVLGFSGGAIYCLPYIKYVFYDAMLDVMHISNAQSGFLL